MNPSDRRFEDHEQADRLLVWLGLLLGWAVLAWPWLSGRFTIPWDAKAHFLPQLQFLAASIAAGDSPFWTPNVFSGHPQIADPQSLIFAPPFFALAYFNAAPTAWAMDATVFVILLISAGAMLRWALDKGWHPAAALLAALSFAFGAAMAWRIQHVGQVMSLAYLPIVLLFLDRALDRRSLAYAAAAGATAGLLVLGRDQVALLCVYFLMAYVVARPMSAPDHGAAASRAIAPIVVAGIAGLLVIAVPTLLTALVAAESNRPAIDLEGAGRGSLHPALLLTFLAPDVFNSSGRFAGEYWGPPSGRWGETGLYLAQNMGQLYAGALPAVLLIFGLVSGWLWQRDLRIFTLSLGFVLLYALGWYTPAFAWMHAALPGVDLYRRPADAVFMIGFLVSILAGGVLDRWLSRTGAAIPRISIMATALIIGFAFAKMFVLAHTFDVLSSAWPAIVTPLSLFLFAAGILYGIRSLRPPSTIALTALVAAFLVADLAWSNGPGGATALPPSEYDVLDPATRNDTIALLKTKTAEGRSDTRRDRVELVGFGFHWPNASLTHGLENTLGYNPLRLGLYTKATGAGDHTGLPDQKGFSPLYPSYRSMLADLLGLRYIATSVPIAQIDKALAPGDLTLVAKTQHGFVYENARALPRVLFATSAMEADFDQMLATGAWPEADLTQAVLLESAADNAPRLPGSARIVSYRNTEVVLEANSPDGGYVVLNDLWQPWWFATVDGTDAAILRANVLFRAVAVPPGRHTIRFTFEPLRGAWAALTKPDRSLPK